MQLHVHTWARSYSTAVFLSSVPSTGNLLIKLGTDFLDFSYSMAVFVSSVPSTGNLVIKSGTDFLDLSYSTAVFLSSIPLTGNLVIKSGTDFLDLSYSTAVFLSSVPSTGNLVIKSGYTVLRFFIFYGSVSFPGPFDRQFGDKVRYGLLRFFAAMISSRSDTVTPCVHAYVLT